MNAQLVIFDCDGVLVDSERLTVGVEARMLTDLGWPLTPDDVVARFLGRSSDAMLAEVASVIGADSARRFDEESTREIHRAFETDLVAVPGVTELVDRLHADGVATCVASSGSHAKMRRTLGLTGLHDRFAGRIFSASEVQHGKPAPDLFLHAARQMGVAPGLCAVVEDSAYGVRAALAAGMAVYGYAGGLTPVELLDDAGAVVFQEMSELGGMLAHSSASSA